MDFDCCLTVPLIASAGDRIELVIARNPYMNVSKMSLTNLKNEVTFLRRDCIINIVNNLLVEFI